MPVCTAAICHFFSLIFYQHIYNLIGQADKQIRFIYFRVKFPQIDFFHGNPPISIFEWVNGQIEIRGAVIYTVQVRRQACPAPYL